MPPPPTLPRDILSQVVSVAIRDNDKPLSILLVHSTFHAIGLRELHQHLAFRTLTRLSRFAQRPPRLVCRPRTVDIHLAEGTYDPKLLVYLQEVFSQCRFEDAEGSVLTSSVRRVNLGLALCTGDPSIGKTHDVFSLVNPETFSWTGPYHDHRVSNAIVPSAALYLLRAARSWTNLQELTLTHISFLAFPNTKQACRKLAYPQFPKPNPGKGSPCMAVEASPLPHLRAITLGQVIHLAPWLVAHVVITQPSLKRFRLLNAYRVSVTQGKKLGMVDIEAELSCANVLEGDGVLARVRRVVICEM